MLEKKDLVVVGAGYAGLSCARAAAARGMDVTVVDRKRDLGERIRTTGILVGEAAALVSVPQTMRRAIPAVRLYLPNGKSIDLHSPGYQFWAVDVPAMMRWMGERAEQAGAQLCLGRNISSIRASDTAVDLAELNVQARFLVGADGARSNVARQLGYCQNRQFLFGVEEEWQGVEGLDSRFLHVFLDKEIAPGYIAWVVPGVGVAQIGVAARKPHLPQLEIFKQRLRQRFDFSRAQLVEKRGGLIPCGGGLKRWAKQRSMLLGDAAGWVSPLTAGGIYPALKIGNEAGEAIYRYLEQGEEHPRLALSGQVPNYVSKRWLRKGMDALQPPNWLMNGLGSNPLFGRLAQTVFFHHRGLKDPRTWKALLTGTSAPPLKMR